MNNFINNNLLNSMEERIKSLKEMSDNQIQVIKKALPYVHEMNNKSHLSSLKIKENIIVNINTIFLLIFGFSSFAFLCFISSLTFLYFSNSFINFDNVKTLFVNMGLISSISGFFYLILSKNETKLEQKINDFTNEYFNNKFEAFSRAQFYFVNNIEIEEDDWQNPKFWKPMEISHFTNWASAIGENKQSPVLLKS